jgi:hypothetical protein
MDNPRLSDDKGGKASSTVSSSQSVNSSYARKNVAKQQAAKTAVHNSSPQGGSGNQLSKRQKRNAKNKIKAAATPVAAAVEVQPSPKEKPLLTFDMSTKKGCVDCLQLALKNFKRAIQLWPGTKSSVKDKLQELGMNIEYTKYKKHMDHPIHHAIREQLLLLAVSKMFASIDMSKIEPNKKLILLDLYGAPRSHEVIFKFNPQLKEILRIINYRPMVVASDTNLIADVPGVERMQSAQDIPESVDFIMLNDVTRIYTDLANILTMPNVRIIDPLVIGAMMQTFHCSKIFQLRHLYFGSAGILPEGYFFLKNGEYVFHLDDRSHYAEDAEVNDHLCAHSCAAYPVFDSVKYVAWTSICKFSTHNLLLFTTHDHALIDNPCLVSKPDIVEIQPSTFLPMSSPAFVVDAAQVANCALRHRYISLEVDRQLRNLCCARTVQIEGPMRESLLTKMVELCKPYKELEMESEYKYLGLDTVDNLISESQQARNMSVVVQTRANPELVVKETSFWSSLWALVKPKIVNGFSDLMAWIKTHVYDRKTIYAFLAFLLLFTRRGRVLLGWFLNRIRNCFGFFSRTVTPGSIATPLVPLTNKIVEKISQCTVPQQQFIAAATTALISVPIEEYIKNNDVLGNAIAWNEFYSRIEEDITNPWPALLMHLITLWFWPHAEGYWKRCSIHWTFNIAVLSGVAFALFK